MAFAEYEMTSHDHHVRLGACLLVFCALALPLTGCRMLMPLPRGSQVDSGLDRPGLDKLYFAGKLDGEFGLPWYLSQLHAFDEPPFPPLARRKSVERYRLTYLPTFTHSVCITLDRDRRGHCRITIKESEGFGGYNPGPPVINLTRALSEEDWDTFQAGLDRLGYWAMPSTHSYSACDGARLILEGVRDGRYHVVDRFSPLTALYQTQAFYGLCCDVLELSRIDEERQKRYYLDHYRLAEEFQISLGIPEWTKDVLARGFDVTRPWFYGRSAIDLVIQEADSLPGYLDLLLNAVPQNADLNHPFTAVTVREAVTFPGAPRLELLRRLLQLGFPVDVPGRRGKCQLYSFDLYLPTVVHTVPLPLRPSLPILLEGGADGSPALYYDAGEDGLDLDTARLLLRHGADPNWRRPDAFWHRDDSTIELTGETPVHRAAAAGRADLLRLFFEHGANPNAADAAGETPLLEACREGHWDVVTVLIEAGARVPKEWALFQAVYRTDAKTVTRLLTDGANALGTFGPVTAFGEALAQGSPKLVEAFLRSGRITNADLHRIAPAALRKLDKHSMEPRTPARLVLDHAPPTPEQATRWAFLVDAVFASQPRYGSELDPAPIRHMLDNGLDFRVFPNRSAGDKALARAASNGIAPLVTLAIEAGALVDARDEDGATPLHNAARHGECDAATVLISAGADANARDLNGCTPLHSVRPEHLMMVRLLLKHGADVNAADARGITVLRRFVEQMQNSQQGDQAAAAVDLLLAAGARRDPGLELLLAVQSDDLAAARAALDAGADVNARTTTGETPLHLAVSSPAQLRLLLDQAQVNVHARDGYGRTALQAAAGVLCAEAVQLLLEHGAVVNRRDFSDTPPLLQAVRFAGPNMSPYRTRTHAVLATGSGFVRKPAPPCIKPTEADKLATVRVLLEAGASPLLKGYDAFGGCNPLPSRPGAPPDTTPLLRLLRTYAVPK